MKKTTRSFFLVIGILLSILTIVVTAQNPPTDSTQTTKLTQEEQLALERIEQGQATASDAPQLETALQKSDTPLESGSVRTYIRQLAAGGQEDNSQALKIIKGHSAKWLQAEGGAAGLSATIDTYNGNDLTLKSSTADGTVTLKGFGSTAEGTLRYEGFVLADNSIASPGAKIEMPQSGHADISFTENTFVVDGPAVVTRVSEGTAVFAANGASASTKSKSFTTASANSDVIKLTSSNGVLQAEGQGSIAGSDGTPEASFIGVAKIANAYGAENTQSVFFGAQTPGVALASLSEDQLTEYTIFDASGQESFRGKTTGLEYSADTLKTTDSCSGACIIASSDQINAKLNEGDVLTPLAVSSLSLETIGAKPAHLDLREIKDASQFSMAVMGNVLAEVKDGQIPSIAALVAPHTQLHFRHEGGVIKVDPTSPGLIAGPFLTKTELGIAYAGEVEVGRGLNTATYNALAAVVYTPTETGISMQIKVRDLDVGSAWDAAEVKSFMRIETPGGPLYLESGKRYQSLITGNEFRLETVTDSFGTKTFQWVQTHERGKLLEQEAPVPPGSKHLNFLTGEYFVHGGPGELPRIAVVDTLETESGEQYEVALAYEQYAQSYGINEFTAEGLPDFPAAVESVQFQSDVSDITRTLRRGISGGDQDVIKLQEALKELGLYTGAIDGDFGPGTELAVKKIESDGVCGPKCRTKIVEKLEAQAPSAPAGSVVMARVFEQAQKVARSSQGDPVPGFFRTVVVGNDPKSILTVARETGISPDIFRYYARLKSDTVRGTLQIPPLQERFDMNDIPSDAFVLAAGHVGGIFDRANYRTTGATFKGVREPTFNLATAELMERALKKRGVKVARLDHYIDLHSDRIRYEATIRSLGSRGNLVLETQAQKGNFKNSRPGVMANKGDYLDGLLTGARNIDGVPPRYIPYTTQSLWGSRVSEFRIIKESKNVAMIEWDGAVVQHGGLFDRQGNLRNDILGPLQITVDAYADEIAKVWLAHHQRTNTKVASSN